jgi:hypothetical protein
MGAILAKAAVMCVALGALALAVAAGDKGTFVPPPESVSESFVRQLTTGRYDRALPFLSRQAAAATDVEALNVLARDLDQSVGGVESVEGEQGDVKGRIAQARARVRGPGAEAIITFALVRELGLWRIDGWTR